MVTSNAISTDLEGKIGLDTHELSDKLKDSLPLKRRRKVLSKKNEKEETRIVNENVLKEAEHADNPSEEETMSQPQQIDYLSSQSIKEVEKFSGHDLQAFLENDLLGPCDDELNAILKLCEDYDP